MYYKNHNFTTVFEAENDIASFEDIMPGADDGLLSRPSSSLGEQNYLQGAIQHIEDYQRGLHGHPVRIIFLYL